MLAGPGQMALDEVLMVTRAPSLRFWRWGGRCLVLGSNQSLRSEIDLAAAAELGFEVVRRMSGGGTMVVAPGEVVTWSLIVPEAAVRGLSFVDSFALLDGFAVHALRSLGVDASYRPINDIVSPGGKIAGAAQARRRGVVLQHTTMAVSLDPRAVPRLIRIGRPPLGERGVRSAEKVVTPVAGLRPGLGVAEVEAALLAAFGPAVPAKVSAGELESAQALAASKYATRAWLERIP